jgi:hypothetical protein
VLAVGDAALSHNPIAGIGIRFALASALAAANVVTTWRDGNAEVASEYYRTFLASARQRHIGLLGKLLADRPTSSPAPTTALPANRSVRFSARRCVTGINRSQSIVPDVAFILRDGGLVRWIGAFDLMILFGLARVPRPLGEMRLGLVAHGLTLESADAVLQWSMERGILSWACSVGSGAFPFSHSMSESNAYGNPKGIGGVQVEDGCLRSLPQSEQAEGGSP